ncbi:hypothetical protein SteCoe_24348 [Stentor coeruleus]|uniref:RBR-type E3 ubiquitin transferase n=1 Tax=Stentor coeruleus TaxID=5963 RepID=A0A1R2BHS7_9CILI|nr:hypothetical protein SteCoe_24348 [Stentor coeruleus]
MDIFPYENVRSNSFKSNHYSIRTYVYNILSEMGFLHEKIQIALLYTDSTDIDELISFLTKGPQGWEHEYIPNEKGLCEICSENASEHSNYLIHNEDRKSQQSNAQSIKERFPIIRSEQETKSSIRICEICYDEVSSINCASICNDHLYCRDCIKNYLEVLISESRILKILCPGKTCNAYFTDTLIQSFISPIYFLKYEKFLQRQRLLKDPFTKFCPQPDCEGYIQGSETDNHKFCNICFFEMCFICGKGWHEEYTCDEVQEKEYSIWAKDKNIKGCPVCKYRIEKNEGCDHMTCIICKHEFCWICLKPRSAVVQCDCVIVGMQGDIAFHNRIYHFNPIKKICKMMLYILLLPIILIALLYYPACYLYFDLMFDEDDYLDDIHLSCVSRSWICFILFTILWVLFAPVITICIVLSKVCKFIKSKCFKDSSRDHYNYLAY